MTNATQDSSWSRKLKVVTVVGTRPEIIRLSRVIPKLDQHCEHILVHTGQNYDYELNDIFFQDLDLRKPDHFLEAAGKSAAETIGNVIIKVDRILEEIQPDALLVLGDTNSCISVLPAKRRKIPTFHMEAGNRCFDQRVPEEINRRIVDHTADVNLTYRDAIAKSEILVKLDLEASGYFLVSAHREENIDPENSFDRLVETLNAVADEYKLPVIVSTHPRTQKRIDESDVCFSPEIRLLKPLGFTDYNKLQLSAKAVLSDSGTINEEASIMNFRALNLREAHERPEGMEEAAAMLVGLNRERVIQGLNILESQFQGDERTIRQPLDYSMPNISEKIVRIIHSYVDYVNRVVWKKY